MTTQPLTVREWHMIAGSVVDRARGELALFDPNRDSPRNDARLRNIDELLAIVGKLPAIQGSGWITQADDVRRAAQDAKADRNARRAATAARPGIVDAIRRATEDDQDDDDDETPDWDPFRPQRMID